MLRPWSDCPVLPLCDGGSIGLPPAMLLFLPDLLWALEGREGTIFFIVPLRGVPYLPLE